MGHSMQTAGCQERTSVLLGLFGWHWNRDRWGVELCARLQRLLCHCFGACTNIAAVICIFKGNIPEGST